MTNYEYVIKCLKIFDKAGITPEFHLQDDVVRYMINCNDVFFWGASDAVEVTPDNLSVLEDSYADLKALGGDNVAYYYTDLLFASRITGMRPQGCVYPKDREVWPLLDECGPEREIELGNPHKPEDQFINKGGENAK